MPITQDKFKMKTKIQKLILCCYLIAPALCRAQPIIPIVTGSSPNNEDGDAPRTAYTKINGNEQALRLSFTNLPTASRIFSLGSGLTIAMQQNAYVQAAVSNALFSTNFIFCDVTNGNDSTALVGSTTLKAQNIQTAIRTIQAICPTNGAVFVAPGVYSMDAISPEGVTISNNNTVELIESPGVTYTQTAATNDMFFVGNTASLFEWGNGTFWTDPNATNQSAITSLIGCANALAVYFSGVSFYGPQDWFDPSSRNLMAVSYKSTQSGLFHADNGGTIGTWDLYPPFIQSVANVTNSSMELVNFNFTSTNSVNPNVNNGGTHTVWMGNGKWHLINVTATNWNTAANTNANVAYGFMCLSNSPSTYALTNCFAYVTNTAGNPWTNIMLQSQVGFSNTFGMGILTCDGTNVTWGATKQY